MNTAEPIRSGPGRVGRSGIAMPVAGSAARSRPTLVGARNWRQEAGNGRSDMGSRDAGYGHSVRNREQPRVRARSRAGPGHANTLTGGPTAGAPAAGTKPA